jgi:probable rRNA maturation factor
MVQISISDTIKFEFAQANILIDAASATLNHILGHQDVELTIAIETDAELQKLNFEYLGINAPTDVLSFPAEEFDPDEQINYIGDIIISFQRAEHQAKTAEHPLINELQLLVVHGTLHLLGYDHAENDQKKTMWELQSDILKKISCNINRLPE